MVRFQQRPIEQKTLWFVVTLKLVNKLMPCAWPSNGALEVWRLRLGLRVIIVAWPPAWNLPVWTMLGLICNISSRTMHCAFDKQNRPIVVHVLYQKAFVGNRGCLARAYLVRFRFNTSYMYECFPVVVKAYNCKEIRPNSMQTSKF